MNKTFAVIFGIAVVLASAVSVLAEGEKASDKRQLALAMPKPKAQVQAPLTVTVSSKKKTSSPTIEPAQEFASRPHLSIPRKSGQVPDDAKAVLVETAAKAEQLSRSYNRRIADLIVWIISSMKESPTFTPPTSPHLQQGLPVELALFGKQHQRNTIFQID